MAIWIAYQNFWTSTFMSSDIGCFEHEQDKLVSKCCFFFLLSKKSFWKLQSASDKKSLSIWVFRISCLQTCWRNFFWKSKKPRWHTYPFKFTRNLCKLENNILISFSRMNCTLANESKHLQRHSCYRFISILSSISSGIQTHTMMRRGLGSWRA